MLCGKFDLPIEIRKSVWYNKKVYDASVWQTRQTQNPIRLLLPLRPEPLIFQGNLTIQYVSDF